MIMVIFPQRIFAQLIEVTNNEVFSEGTFYINLQDSILYSDAIVVKFNNMVIDAPAGSSYFEINNLIPEYSNLNSLFTNMSQNYGGIQIIKQVPNAVWGDTIRINKRTGEEVAIQDLSQLYTIKFFTPVPINLIVNEFLNLQVVEYTHEPISVIYYDSPNDPKYTDGSQWGFEHIQAVNAWDITHGSTDVRIGIVDNGTKQNHNDLDKIDGGNSWEASHGTQVAGVAGATTNNSEGVASLGWNLHLYTYGRPPQSNISAYIPYYVNNIISATSTCDVINISWGTFKHPELEDIPSECPCPEYWIGSLYMAPEHYPEIQTAVFNAISQGVVCIAAAGNTSKNSPRPNCNFPELCDPMWIPYDTYPALYSGVIAVTATRYVDHFTDEFEDSYNWNNFVDVSAPGIDIWTTNDNGDYISKNGTSFSSPLVSALAGLITSMAPDNENLTVQMIQDIITYTADKIDPSNCPGNDTYDANGWNPCLGYGRINAYAALNLIDSPPSAPTSLTLSGSIGQNPLLNWDSGDEADLISNVVYRKRVGIDNNFVPIATVNPFTSTYIDYGITIVPGGDNVYYRLKSKDVLEQLSLSYSNTVRTKYDAPGGKVKLHEFVQLPKDFELRENHPNPFNPITTIKYDLPEKSIVFFNIYDILGKEIKTIVHNVENSGFKKIIWDSTDKNGNSVSSGIYFYRLDAVSKESDKEFHKTKKMLLLQ